MSDTQWPDPNVNEDLADALTPWLEELDSFEALRHPLVYQVPYHNVGFMNQMANRQYAYKRKAISIAKRAGDWDRYIFLHERPYRMFALRTVIRLMDPGDSNFWSTIRDVYIDTENLWQHLPIWLKLLTSKRPNREAMMDQEERDFLESLPETFTIYRGVRHRTAVESISWTLDKARGEWFARRFSPTGGYLATGIIKKKDVIAYFAGRNEKEIVCLYKDVQKVRVTKVKPNPKVK